MSIAFFNFFGISVTKAMSASHRMVLDSLRTVAVLIVSIALGWEEFHYEQVREDRSVATTVYCIAL